MRTVTPAAVWWSRGQGVSRGRLIAPDTGRCRCRSSLMASDDRLPRRSRQSNAVRRNAHPYWWTVRHCPIIARLQACIMADGLFGRSSQPVSGGICDANLRLPIGSARPPRNRHERSRWTDESVPAGAEYRAGIPAATALCLGTSRFVVARQAEFASTCRPGPGLGPMRALRAACRAACVAAALAAAGMGSRQTRGCSDDLPQMRTMPRGCSMQDGHVLVWPSAATRRLPHCRTFRLPWKRSRLIGATSQLADPGGVRHSKARYAYATVVLAGRMAARSRPPPPSVSTDAATSSQPVAAVMVGTDGADARAGLVTAIVRRAPTWHSASRYAASASAVRRWQRGGNPFDPGDLTGAPD